MYYQTDDIDDLYSWDQTDFWDADCVQLSAGGLGYRVKSISLPDLRMNREQVAASLRAYQRYQGSGLTIGILLDADKPAKWCGNEIDRQWAFVFDSRDHAFSLPRHHETLTIEVSSEVADQFGLDLFAGTPWTVDQRAVIALVKKFDEIYTFHRRKGDSDRARRIDQERFVGLLISALVQRTDLQPRRCYELVRRSEDLIDQLCVEDDFTIKRLADALNSPRRTLDRAFHAWTDVGAAKYLRLVRLHRMRSILKGGGSSDSVTAAALVAGFNHFGKTAKHYHKHFGELPRTTLRRAREDRTPNLPI